MRKKKYYIGKNKLGTNPVNCIDKLPRMLRRYYSMLLRLKFAKAALKMNMNGSFGSSDLGYSTHASNEEVNRLIEESLKKRQEMKKAYNTGGWQTINDALNNLHHKP